MCVGLRQWILGKTVKALALLVVAASLTLIVPQAAHACSCASASTQDQLDAADVVVLGAVDGPDAMGPNFLAYIGIVPTVIYKVHVTGVFKGDVGPDIQVSTNASGAACGWESIEKGAKYLVFAAQPADSNSSQLRGTLCGGTRPASASETAELVALAGKPGTPDLAVPKPNDPDQWLILIGALGTTLLIGAFVWRRQSRQSIN